MKEKMKKTMMKKIRLKIQINKKYLIRISY